MERKLPTRLLLEEKELPRSWYNINAIMKDKHEPMLNPKTLKPCTEEELSEVFCSELVKQELNMTDEYIPIPDEVMDFYKMVRPAPLIRAYCLEKVLGTPAEIYYKFEGNNTSGSHKLNSAIAQAYYAKKQGLTTLTTETGAGQWGTALSMACAYYGMDLTVYMVKCSAEQKPFRRAVMRTYDANVIPSPSTTTEAGRKILAEYPDTVGSLGCAISEAIETAKSKENCKYVLGSVLDYVVLHQSIIGLETKIALEKYGVEPDVLISCVGGGSNFGGFIAPFLKDKINGTKNYKIIGVEPESCPSLTRGRYAYDYGDTGKTTPLMKMYTLGNGFMPVSSHSGGLRYHGLNSALSKLYHDGYFEAVTVKQTEIFDAAVKFAKSEGILPAPESSHSIKVAIDEALKCKQTGEKKKIVFCLTGTGYFDLKAYTAFKDNEMQDYTPTEEDLAKGFATIPDIPQNRK
ncbi:MAG: TrpB-like pyridoxal phosphate-dependent enzyme [Clostridiales bacterium]|nr:TrpB-like pyridoxal phosphate-dependent enzyme [Clostridiales bacterium]